MTDGTDEADDAIIPAEPDPAPPAEPTEDEIQKRLADLGPAGTKHLDALEYCIAVSAVSGGLNLSDLTGLAEASHKLAKARNQIAMAEALPVYMQVTRKLFNLCTRMVKLAIAQASSAPSFAKTEPPPPEKKESN